ncbi:hypothetical protein M2317_001317 [Microbacterium sp. ZKA21]
MTTTTDSTGASARPRRPERGDLPAVLERHLWTAGLKSQLPESEVRALRTLVLADCARTQARVLEPLPTHVWPNGRPPLP